MGKWICGKCQCESTYYQDGAVACMMCGNRTPSRWGFTANEGAIRIKPMEGKPLDPEEIEDEHEDTEDMNMPSKRGVCINCGKERSLPANDKCWKCNGYGKKASEKKQKPVPAEMPPEKVKILKTKIRARLAEKLAEKDSAIDVDKLPDPLPIAKIEGQAATLLSPDPRIVLLDFTLPENFDLYEPWVKYGRSHRRGPGDQAMMAVEQILTNEGLI